MFKYIFFAVAIFGLVTITNQHKTIQELSSSASYLKNQLRPELAELTLQRDNQRVKYTPKDLECLSRNIFFEAGTEDTFGKYAVAQVTLNRMRSGYWGKSICTVVYSPEQFSWTKEDGLKNVKVEGPNWYESQAVARAVLAQGLRIKALNKALFYHADYVNPGWRDEDKFIGKIGHHVFYTGGKDSWVRL